ncbi:hypothetical protein R70006_04303 [Paraburkholderia domus]|nr:hypothetical protein R70006_04303 [Paraburkholderia domus]
MWRIGELLVKVQYLTGLERKHIAVAFEGNLLRQVGLVTPLRNALSLLRRLVMLAPAVVDCVRGPVATRRVLLDEQRHPGLTVVVVVQPDRFRHAPHAAPDRPDGLGSGVGQSRVAPERHDALITRIRIKVIAEDDDFMVLRLFKAEPDAFVGRNALDEGERGFVVLGEVFVTFVLRPQVEPEVDAYAIPVVAQRISDNFLR